MLNILISGSSGFMGRTVASLAAKDKDISIAAGVDPVCEKYADFPVYASIDEFKGEADVVIDFSAPAALGSVLTYCVSAKTPLVLCTTGHSAEQLSAIEKAAEQIPLLRSGNMSLGINVLLDLVRRTCSVLGGAYDVEIVERHHRRKADAPSGTALMLAEAAAAVLPADTEYVYDRHGRRQPRPDNEIGISSVRGGTEVGVHEVIFMGPDEVIEIKHTATSRGIFATGALKAAKFLLGAGKPGLYSMNDVINGVSGDM